MTDTWTIIDIDVARGIGPVAGCEPATHARLVLRHGHAVVGHLDLLAEQFPISAAHIRERFAHQAAAVIAARAQPHKALPPRADGSADTSHIPRLANTVASTPTIDLADTLHPEPPSNELTVDVVICTRGRGDRLGATLDALGEQATPAASIIVVDNNDAPDPAIGHLAHRHGAQLVHEPRAGLSYARNAGVAAATADIVAFTDDDAVPDPHWCAELRATFARHRDAEAVTGMILPDGLASPAEVAFEVHRGGFGTGVLPIRYDHTFVATTGHAPPVWNIGAGANMAVLRATFERVGHFDTRLGAGAAGCSEDSELWYRILAERGVCVYEPLAVVRHQHRATDAELRSQLDAYMEGHAAALVAQADRHDHPHLLRRIRRTLPRYYAGNLWRSLRGRHLGRARHDLAEIRGLARGARYVRNASWRADDDVTP